MKYLSIFAVLFTMVMTSQIVGRADDPTIRQQLKAEYMKADAATRAKDLDRLMSQYSEDFRLKVNQDKTLSRKQVGDLVHWQIVATKEIKELSYTILSVTVKGKTAMATVKQTETLVVVLQSKPHVLASTQISEDTWILTPKGWRLKYQEVKQNRTTSDGKLIPQVSYAPIYSERYINVA